MRDTASTSSLLVPRGGRPFRAEFTRPRVDELRRRITSAVVPAQATGDNWYSGPPNGYMRDLLDEWSDAFDFSAAEDSVNRFSQYQIPVLMPDGVRLDVHVTVEPGSNLELPPIVMTHGWPSLPYEFYGMVERISHPERSGGRAEDGATVILPSLPGFGYSSTPRPLHAREIAAVWHQMMREAFACDRFFVHGGDWGAVVSSWMAVDAPQHLFGIHLSMLGLRPNIDPALPLDDEEKRWVKEVQRRLAADGGYREQHATRPTTLGYGLCDSPAFMAAWLIDKYHGWGGAKPDQDPRIPRQEVLKLLSLYWFSSSLNTAGWIYHADRSKVHELAPGQKCEVPTACAFFENGFFPPPPTRWIERGHNLHLRRDFPDGGHFPSLCKPIELADAISEWHRYPNFLTSSIA